MDWDKQDRKQFSEKGIPISRIEKQLSVFEQGIPWIKLERAAKVGDGIRRIEGQALQYYIQYYEAHIPETILKFVPASGAASRMFKALFACEQGLRLKGDPYLKNLKTENPQAWQFFSELHNYPFYLYLEDQKQELAEMPVETVSQALAVLQWLLYEDGLAYGRLPKGLLDFHRYGRTNRTAFEEHLVEGAGYAQTDKGEVHIHFTVSPEHIDGFKTLQEEIAAQFEKELNVSLNIEYSTQDAATDTLAVTMENKPFREQDGRIVFRPGGHGALINNLQQLRADLVFIKNIDNVVPDRMKEDTIVYKKLLAGVLLEIQDKAFGFLRELDKEQVEANLPERIITFLEDSLFLSFTDDITTLSAEDQLRWCRSMLDRPLRVCGMVRNEGEPGGGPFFVMDKEGTSRLQIVEKAQIDTDDKQQSEILSQSSHFNPVDLVCSTRNYKGEYFDLEAFMDPETAFISVKSRDGRELKALELPGLWNGAMARWNTLFVEVPLSTFNPVKTITDLLRPQHQ